VNDNISNTRSLLLAKDIDPDDYHQMRFDCLSKIAILENKIKLAVISLSNFKKDLENMRGSITAPCVAFEGGDIVTKRRLISLFFEENIIWNEKYLNGYFNNQVKIVCNFTNSISPMTFGNEISTGKGYDFSLAEYQKIVSIEKIKGRDIAPLLAQNTIVFLYGYAKCIMELYGNRYARSRI
jgi:hypothetical protein